MRRVLITGGSGFLGGALLRSLPPGWEAHTTRRSNPVSGAVVHDCDLSDRAATLGVWDRVRPEVVIHTAYSTSHGERDIREATVNVVDACAASGAALLHMSSDVVLDGEHAPYDESADPRPVHEYGRLKAMAEGYVLQRLPDAAVVRTSLITSFHPLDPRSAWVAAGLRGEIPLTLFADELRCPAEVGDLARQLWELVLLPESERGGVWHLAGPEALSRYALGILIAATLRLPPDRLRWGTSRDSPDPRPRDLRLLTARADALLRSRIRPISQVAAEALAAPAEAR